MASPEKSSSNINPGEMVVKELEQDGRPPDLSDAGWKLVERKCQEKLKNEVRNTDTHNESVSRTDIAGITGALIGFVAGAENGGGYGAVQGAATGGIVGTAFGSADSARSEVSELKMAANSFAADFKKCAATESKNLPTEAEGK